MDSSNPGFAFAIALAAGVAGQVAARHLRVPAIVLLLGLGVALGPDGLGWIDPRSLGAGLLTVVSLAVAIILFEGGMALQLERLRHAASPVQRLVTLGALVTVIGGAAAASLILELPPDRALLYGTLVIVTGPTVIRPILRFTPVRSRLATVLEAEGLLIDPVGAIVAAVALEIVISGTLESAALGAAGLVGALALGAGAGLAIGFALAFLMRAENVVPEGLENLVVLGATLAGFVVCETVLSESGILAVIVAGVVLANWAPQRARHVGEFQELLTFALIGLLFVLLAADVRLADIFALGWRGVAVVAALAFVVRPIGVWLCLRASGLDLREQLFVAWLGPRGVVAAAFASIVSSSLESHGLPAATSLRALVFLTIALTVVVLGGGAPLVAWLLKVRAAGRDAVVILGAEELGLALAARLRQGSDRVILVDNNPAHCAAAENAGFSVVFGDALAPTTRARMQLERARIVIGLTSSAQLNQLFAAEAGREHGVRELYVAAARDTSGASARLATHHAARVLFDRPKDIARWNVRLRHGLATPKRVRFAGGVSEAAPAAKAAPDAFLIAAVLRGGRWSPMHAAFEPKRDDEALALLHRDDEAAAIAGLAALGWEVTGTAETLAPPGELKVAAT